MAAKTGCTICRFQKEREILLVLALGKRENTVIPSSLSLPTSFSPFSGWTQLSDKPSPGAARAPCGSLGERRHSSCKRHTVAELSCQPPTSQPL